MSRKATAARMTHAVQHGLGAHQAQVWPAARAPHLPHEDQPPRRRRCRAAPRAPRAVGSRRPGASSCAAGRTRRTRPASSRRSAGIAAPPPRADGLPQHRSACSGQARRSGCTPGAGHRRCGCRRTRAAPCPHGSGIVEHRPGEADELLGEHPGARVRAPTVHALERRPTGTFPGCRERHRPDRVECGQRDGRDGRGQDARDRLSAGPLDQHVDRAVGRRALLPEGRVVRVQHDRAGEARHGRPGTGTAPDDNGPAGPCLVPRGRGRAASTPQPGAEAFRPPRGRHQHHEAASPDADARVPQDREHQVDQVGGRREPHHGHSGTGEGTVPLVACGTVTYAPGERGAGRAEGAAAPVRRRTGTPRA